MASKKHTLLSELPEDIILLPIIFIVDLDLSAFWLQ